MNQFHFSHHHIYLYFSFKKPSVEHFEFPSIRDIQLMLVEMEDKPQSFVGSREWIGSFEVCLIIDKIYDVPCKIKHISSGKDLIHSVDELHQHFEKFGSPIMMGGDQDCSSKGILGVASSTNNEHFLLVADPHYYGKPLASDQELYRYTSI